MTVYSQASYCQCGKQIWIEYLYGASGWHCRFFDDEHKECVDCPDCGRKLKEEELESV